MLVPIAYHYPYNPSLDTKEQRSDTSVSDKVRRRTQSLWHLVLYPYSWDTRFTEFLNLLQHWADVESPLLYSNTLCTDSAPLSSAVLLMVYMHVNEGRIKYGIFKKMFFKA